VVDLNWEPSNIKVNCYPVAVIIWKHQDRLCQAGFPGDLEDGLMKLYDQTTWADKELKKIYSNCASFLQYSPSLSGHKGHENAPIVPLRHLACVALLSTAHKVIDKHEVDCHLGPNSSILDIHRTPSLSVTQLSRHSFCVYSSKVFSHPSLTCRIHDGCTNIG
jgi:hypothetical protein